MSMINVTADLESLGWSLQNLPVGAVDLLNLKQLAQQKYLKGQYRSAGVGTNAKKISGIRGDEISWLENEPEMESLQKFLEMLRINLSEYFRCHLGRFEGHFSYYAPGTKYQAHLDQSGTAGAGSRQRVFSLILYLNESWHKGDGGELRLLFDDRAVDIEPRLGNMMIFRSDTIVHEVLETKAGRWAVSGWFRRK